MGTGLGPGRGVPCDLYLTNGITGSGHIGNATAHVNTMTEKDH